MTAIDGEQLRRDYRKINRALRDLQVKIRSNKRAIQDDPALTEEQRKIKLRQLSDEGLTRQQTLHHTKLKLSAKVRQHAKQVRMEYQPDESAQANVNRLLDQGIAVGVILKRAVDLGDGDKVLALRRALQYLGNGEGDLVTEDTRELRGIVSACDRALSEIGRTDRQREMHRALIDLDALDEQGEQFDRYAAKVALGSENTQDTIAFGFAENDAERGD
jgi:hypothetical protein